MNIIGNRKKAFCLETLAECTGVDAAEYYDAFEAVYNQLSEHDPEVNQYFYHPDHLGSSSFITNASGDVDQHLQYLPFGEPWIDQRTSNNIRFTFSGKERDEETGYNYFGARYYNADISIWLSVDPLSDKFPSLTGYNYCFNNPIKLIDPNGMEPTGPGDPNNEFGDNNYVMWTVDVTAGQEFKAPVPFLNSNDSYHTAQNRNSSEDASKNNRLQQIGLPPNDGFYGAPLKGEMYITDSWGNLQARKHNGLDIVYSGSGQVNGENIYAPVSGKIVRLVDFEDGDPGGARIRIKDANGDEHGLYHLQIGSNSHLKGSTHVTLGQVVGRVGSSGKSTGPHLHYEVWLNGERSNRPDPASINPFLKNLPQRK